METNDACQIGNPKEKFVPPMTTFSSQKLPRHHASMIFEFNGIHAKGVSVSSINEQCSKGFPLFSVGFRTVDAKLLLELHQEHHYQRSPSAAMGMSGQISPSPDSTDLFLYERCDKPVSEEEFPSYWPLGRRYPRTFSSSLHRLLLVSSVSVCLCVCVNVCM